MTLEETIKQYRDWAEEWEALANLVKEDEEAGHKCQFSEGSEAYFKDAKQARQIACWLEELEVYKKALELACVALEERSLPTAYFHRTNFLKKAREQG